MTTSPCRLILVLTITRFCSSSDLFPTYSVNSKCSDGSSITDADRAGILEAYNQMRSDVSSGGWMVIGGLTLPKAKNMQVLTWDCDLEKLASAAVKNCPPTPTVNPLYGQAFTYSYDGVYKSIIDALNPRNTLSTQPGFNMTRSKLQFTGNSNLQQFSNIIRANTTRVGCSSATCAGEQRNSSTAVCFFNSPDVQNGEVVYEIGTPCRKNIDCTSTIFEVCIARSLCYYNPIARLALDLHNGFRSAIALGKAMNDNNVTLPMAGQMNRLEYLLSLERIAQNEAEKWALATAPPPPMLVGPVGPAEWNWMSIAPLDANVIANEMNATDRAIRNWWNLRHKIDKDIMTSLFTTYNVTNPAPQFVELGRGNYTHVGCATAKGDDNYTVVCAYKLRGPLGTELYLPGDPCTLCVYSTCDPLDGLCMPNEVLSVF
nr:SCP extracellular domain containing protein [Haemonchus contortus]